MCIFIYLWKKTQYIKVSKEIGNALVIETIKMGHFEFKKVKRFKYLGIPDTKKWMKIEILVRN